jgi:hypothetical protein
MNKALANRTIQNLTHMVEELSLALKVQAKRNDELLAENIRLRWTPWRRFKRWLKRKVRCG